MFVAQEAIFKIKVVRYRNDRRRWKCDHCISEKSEIAIYHLDSIVAFLEISHVCSDSATGFVLIDVRNELE